MAWWGLTYLFIKQRTKIEKFADQTTVKHGLGWQLYLWADYVLNKSTANKGYLKMKQTKYLSPAQILRYMKDSALETNWVFLVSGKNQIKILQTFIPLSLKVQH